MLDSLGFIWKLKRPDDFWTEKLDELKNYKAQYGNVNPPRDGEWKLLACWVDRYVSFDIFAVWFDVMHIICVPTGFLVN